MKQLFKLAIKGRKHLSLFIISLFTLIMLTFASQLEMCALGVMANSGADFFTLFGSKESKQLVSKNSITLQEVQNLWQKIDSSGKGEISRKDANAYLAKKKESNPLLPKSLSWVMSTLRQKFYQFDVHSNISTLVWMLVCVAVFKAIWLFASRYTTQLLSIRISRDLRQHYFEHIQSLPMSFYQRFNIGSLSSRVVGDAQQISLSINSCLTNYLQSPFTILSSLFGCVYISWRLSLVIFIGIPLFFMPIIFFASRVKRASRQLQHNQESFASVLIDYLAGIQTVKIFSMENFSLLKYSEQNNRMANLEGKTAKYGLLTRPILHAITTLCLAIVVVVGLYILGLPVSLLLVFCGLFMLAYEPIKKFAEENSNIQRGIVAAERMFEVLNIKPNIENKDGALPLTSFDDQIEFERVWFRYQDNWILEDLSFTIKKGETVAIVGSTGAGKSTIAQLLPRLYDVEKGDIKIDGRSLTDYTQESLRESIAFVSQKPFLFSDTIANNIAFGKNFSREEIEEAARRAHATEFIDELPMTYDTVLAEAGQNLSGGQQQRLAIARALVKKSPILILDEATSALDGISENRIKEAIAELQGEMTQIIITHRLVTIEYADRIIYLENGKKLAEGTLEELLKNCLPFRMMWKTMFQTQLDSISG